MCTFKLLIYFCERNNSKQMINKFYDLFMKTPHGIQNMYGSLQHYSQIYD